MPTHHYDQIRIQSFLARRVDLEDFCFVLTNKFRQKGEERPMYAYQNLAGVTPAAKSKSLVEAAFHNDELGELVFQLVVYWLDHIHGNPRVLRNTQLYEDLALFGQELVDRGDHVNAGQVQELLQRIGPLPPPLSPSGRRFEHGYAVLIGVGEHEDARISPLPATVKDPNRIQEVLLHPARCAYLDEHVHLVTGPGATRQSILGVLDCLADKARQDSQATVIFYFSGHGWKDETTSPPRYYLIPYDCDWDDVDATAVRDDLFTDKLNAISAERLVIVLDACHAGGTTKEPVPLLLPKDLIKAAPSTLHLHERLGSGSGRVVLSSCREGELSYVCRDGSMSVFTACLVEALSGRVFEAHAGQFPAEIGVLAVFNHLDRCVPARVKEEQRKDPRTGKPAEQHPVLDGSKTNNFPIALLLGRRSKASA